jgi:hypothetical protein
MNMKNKTLTIIALIIVVSCFTLSSCTDRRSARKALERSGYKPINVGGYCWFGGSGRDTFITRFKAVAPNGETVTGCVTKGLFKGSTIRVND